VLKPAIASVVAVAVGVAWGALSVVFFWDPDYSSPVRLLDYLAVVLFSVALAALAPAAWLIVKVGGNVERAHRPTGIAVMAAGTAFGLLTLADGGMVLTLVAWIVVGLSVGLGPSVVIRAAAVIVAISGPLGGFGNLIEDGLGAKAVGSSLYLLGVGGSVESLHEAFMNSPAHKANIVYTPFKHVGIGTNWDDGRLWVTVIFEATTNPGTRLSMPSCN